MKITHLSTGLLTLHPILKTLPPPDPALIESMKADIAARGISQPLIVDGQNRVMDGRIRLRAALDLGIEVPVLREWSRNAPIIALQNLIQRRHYTKSALAYLAYPFLEPAIEEIRKKQAANLKKGIAFPDSAQNALSAKTAEQLAHSVGIGRRLFFAAQQIHKLFRKTPSLKEQLEWRILANEHPEALSLGPLIAGIEGRDATIGKPRPDYGQLELFSKATDTLVIRFRKLATLNEADRIKAAVCFAASVDEWPEEIRFAVSERLGHPHPSKPKAKGAAR